MAAAPDIAERRRRDRQRKRRQRQRENTDRWSVRVSVPGKLIAAIATAARVNARELTADYLGTVIGDLLELWHERDRSRCDTKGSIHRVMSNHGTDEGKR